MHAKKPHADPAVLLQRPNDMDPRHVCNKSADPKIGYVISNHGILLVTACKAKPAECCMLQWLGWGDEACTCYEWKLAGHADW